MQGRVITLRVCGGVYFGVLYIVLRDAHWDRAAGAVGWRGVCVCSSVCAWGGVLVFEPVGCAGGGGGSPRGAARLFMPGDLGRDTER